MKDVAGKVAVVTGAASGIGRGMAESFAAAGMKVVLADVEEGALGETTEALRATGADVLSVLTDVAKAEQVQALADQSLKQFGAVHVLCSNAGIGVRAGNTWETTLDDWKWMIDVNLMGVVHGVRTFVPIMLEQGSESHIVNTSSLGGLIPGGDSAIYGVTKFGVVALSEFLYLELKQAGASIGVSVLCPGLVNTNIMSCERNRPAELPDASPAPSGPVADAISEWIDEQIADGLSPRQVGDQVLSSIRERRFYIFTHPELSSLVEHRMKLILEGENPERPALPGVESLMEKLRRLFE
jgi:NAD(P)-dependent dehydrogenase (short-subunit alcohol dehydrogenase family)